MSFESPKKKGPTPGSEEYKELKEKLNKEGFEGDEDGGAALFIGTKEEAEKARTIAETEGRAENLEIYIRMHKQVIPKEELEQIEGIKHFRELTKGKAEIQDLGNKIVFVYYKDGNGDLAHVEIDTRKIAKVNGNMTINLEALGFNPCNVGYLFSSPLQRQTAEGVWLEVRRRRAEKNREEKKKGFNL